MKTISKWASRIFSPVESLILAMIFAIVFILTAPLAYAVNQVKLKPDGANAAPATVFGTPNNGVSIGKTTAPNSALDIVGVITLSSSTTAGSTARWLGALAAKPSTSVEGDQYYDTVQHTIALATATKSDNSAWLKANTATTGAAWTTY